MSQKIYTLKGLRAWQIAFLLLSSSWLFAPLLNHALSYRTSLISQYETPSQPFSWLFRLCDLLGGLTLGWMAYSFIKKPRLKKTGIVLMICAIGLSLDPLLTTTCKTSGSDLTSCVEYYSFSFLLHAIETTVTAGAIFILAVYDAARRKKLVSIGFTLFQVAYFGLFITQFATHARYNTLTQFLYQLVTIVWLAWFGRDNLTAYNLPVKDIRVQLIKYAVAAWAFLNGILAIILSIFDIHLFGNLHGIYFARDNAWLAQHSVAVGVAMLYLSRHLSRGESRARQIFLAIIGLEVLKYSLLTPNFWLLGLYLITFCLLFIWADIFDRGTVPLTWHVRLKDLLYMVIGLTVALVVALLLVDRDDRLSNVTYRAVRHFHDYTLTNRVFPHGHLSSILLAHTISAFIVIGGLALLWTLFRPYKVKPAKKDYSAVKTFLELHSSSSEDFFKLWPKDKNYFWSSDGAGFVAYKIVGPVAFALADPITKDTHRQKLILEYVSWCRQRRLRVCFLPIDKERLPLYESAGLATLQIGASALISAEHFLNDTTGDKWWRWQKNRATKNGYQYASSSPPHTHDFLNELRKVSDGWLGTGGHQERGFALGHFDPSYLQDCTIHYLKDNSGRIIAFTNELPVFRRNQTASVDLLRYLPDYNNSMPYLMLKTVEATSANNANTFDLGFVPFAALNNPALQLAKILSAGRFSSKGLEQFKNKFDPEWRPNYLAYDGDLADLALIALNLERAMEL